MFTGIIEEVGTVRAVQHSGSHSFIRFEAKTVLEDVHRGDSIAVNGVCLTVTQFDSMSFQADVMNETLRRSALGSLTNGSHVNLERAMPANGRFGGHIVSGHIDGTGTVTRIEPDGIAVRITVAAAPELLRLIVEKGSVTIDGISLTAAAVSDRDFGVSVIPHTLANTALHDKKTGDPVNLENDIIGKYIEKMLKPAADPAGSRISAEFLAANGFL